MEFNIENLFNLKFFNLKLLIERYKKKNNSFDFL
jgi:hypothetical protein